jgi:hypothetical protein
LLIPLEELYFTLVRYKKTRSIGVKRSTFGLVWESVELMGTKGIGVEEFPLKVKISQNPLQSSPIHLIPPFPKQALNENIHFTRAAHSSRGALFRLGEI